MRNGSTGMYKKIVLIFMATFVFFSGFSSGRTALAHDTYYLQTLVSQNDYSYQYKAIRDKKKGTSNECQHMEFKLGDFKKMFGGSLYPAITKEYNLEETENSEGGLGNVLDPLLCDSKDNPMVFGFSPQHVAGKIRGTTKNHATKNDGDRAETVGNTMIPAINAAMYMIYGNKPQNADELYSRGKELGDAVAKVADGGTATVNGATLRQGRVKESKKKVDPVTGLSSSDYLTIEKGGKTAEFPYRIVKGYATDGGKGFNNKKLVNKFDENYKSDVKYITWNMLIYQANYNLAVHGLDTTASSQINGSSLLENQMVELLQNVLLGLTSILGLEKMGDLVFNEGNREVSTHYGAFSNQWESIIMTFYWIFQAIAWSLILLAFFKLLFLRNLSIMNPQMRISLMEGAQDLIITGVALMVILPLINFLLILNSSLVSVFANVGVDLNDLASVNNYDGTLGGVLMQFYYFFINIWLNFVYIIRGITIAILMVMAPLFVASIAFGGKWKGLFTTFVKELTGNIFLQSFHAFIVTFLFAATTGTRGIETAVTFFALIILTEFFRSLLFGNAAGVAGKVGMSSVAAGAGLAIGASRSMNKGKGKSNGNAKQGSSNESSGENASSGEFGAAGNAGASGIRTTDSSTFTAKQSGVNAGAGSGQPGSGDNGGTLDVYRNAQNSKSDSTETTGASSAAGGMQGAKNGTSASNNPMKALGGKVGEVSPGFKRAAGVVGGATLAAGGAVVGASYMAAYSGANPAAAAAGGAMVGVTTAKGFEAAMKSKGGGSNSAKAASVAGGGAAGADGSSDAGSQQSWQRDMVDNPSFLSYKSHADGKADIHEDVGKLSEQGILRANDTDDGNTRYTYDTSKMSEQDAQNIHDIQNRFVNGTDADRQELRAQGIENVSTNGAGNTIVDYNQVGRERLGIQAVRTEGGRMTRTVGSSQATAPVHSYAATSGAGSSTAQAAPIPPAPFYYKSLNLKQKSTDGTMPEGIVKPPSYASSVNTTGSQPITQTTNQVAPNVPAPPSYTGSFSASASQLTTTTHVAPNVPSPPKYVSSFHTTGASAPTQTAVPQATPNVPSPPKYASSFHATGANAPTQTAAPQATPNVPSPPKYASSFHTTGASAPTQTAAPQATPNVPSPPKYAANVNQTGSPKSQEAPKKATDTEHLRRGETTKTDENK